MLALFCKLGRSVSEKFETAGTFSEFKTKKRLKHFLDFVHRKK